jgi:flagellar biosynthesis GTPase FlhF
MKRTKKINKKNKILNKKKTSKRRFNKKGGVQKKCDVCGIAFHMTGTVGAPPKSQLFGAELFEDHIKTHPICKYCNTKNLDVNRLIDHIKSEHPDNYNTAKKIKFGILNESNLIDELRNKNQSIVGYSPDFDLFYDAIDKAAIEKMNLKPINKNVSNKPLKVDVKSKQRENNIEKQKKETEIAEQLESSRRALAEEQRILREAAEKRKQEKLEAAEKEAQSLKEQAQALKKEKEKEKKAAKRLAKDQEQETAAMGAEEIMSKEFNAAIKEAESVDEVIDIIENNKTKLSSAASEFVPSKKQEQKPLRLTDILIETDFQYLPVSKWYLAIQKLYPALSGYTEIVRANSNYINISFFIIFLMGVINFRLNAKKINLKLILKGGKASQMLMSTYGINNTDILTDDVDILLVQEGIYDYNFLLNFANDFAGFINYFFNYQLSILAPPNPTLTNKNIVKISFVNNGFIPLSDIDFKQIESEYLQGENIISSTSVWNVVEKSKTLYTYNLLFYHQSLEAFIAEKKYYLQIYDNIIQKKTETENCDCADIHDHECSQICDYRNKMLDKFHKYINPLEQIQQTINNK